VVVLGSRETLAAPEIKELGLNLHKVL